MLRRRRQRVTAASRVRRTWRRRFAASEEKMDALYEFEEILDRMNQDASRARKLVQEIAGFSSITYRRAEGYWMSALADVLGKSNWHGVSMQDTFNELEEGLDSGQYDED